MKLAVPKETKFKENRVALTPDVVKDLVKKGFEVQVESGCGMNSFFSDDAYTAAGAQIVTDVKNIYGDADVVLKVNAPSPEEIAKMKKGGILISFLFAATNPDVVNACCNAGVSAFSVDAIPRISRAQKMDALSSQANLAGYKAVLMAANQIGKILPMMTTAAGTIKPTKIVIFGAGVAGLQAVATAKRLGAVVEVTDIRPETKEQVESLGGKFIEVKGDASVKIEGGYVKGVSDEFLKMQQELVGKHVQQADIVITTALIPGRKAPVLVTEEMVKSMKFGSVIVDMAVESGGNVVGSELNKNIVKNGVTIIGEGNIPSLLPMNASDLYAKNIATFLTHLADKDKFNWEMEEEITKGSLIVHAGVAVHPSVAKALPA
ncbi:MAG: Re/Si-specific NAD(P)(+) transhydrogenase subunit alpha [Bacteroidetes bacterium]|nr:Re/Si-specific NAD(P)(+) transhydrogenase subunit alpha [Bacteroidota bacterium]PHX82836.1 MAG: NAD(P)(+) transhydrogenase (Re/Si-specific) subunit alpha [Flavobacteriales bacterium]